MVQQCGFVNGAGVIVQTSGDGQVHGKILFRYAKGGQVRGDGLQLGKAGVKERVSAPVAFQRGKNLGIGAPDGDEAENLVGLALRQAAVLQQNELDLVGADLIQLVNGAHDVAALVPKAQHIIKAGENLPVVDPNLEPAQAEAPEDLVDDGGDLRLVENVQLAVADDVDVGLIEFPEPAPLGTLAPVDLADLEPAEGEGQLIAVQRHILCQRHRQVKPQSQVAVAFGKAVDLLFGFAAALGKEDLGILDGRGIQRGKAVGGVGFTKNLHQLFKADLLVGQQLHKAGEGAGLDDIHKNNPFYLS